MIRFDGVSKRYPNEAATAVDDLSLHIRPGEICMLVGPSGCGKTTFLRMLLGDTSPSRGQILLDGTPLKAEPLPAKLVAVTVPFTSRAVAGLFLLMPTPLFARIRNWLFVVEAKLPPAASAQTKAPVCSAWAPAPMAGS